MHKKVSVLRDFHSFTVGLTDVEIAPPNDRRIAMIISPPPLVIGTGQPLEAVASAASVASLGIKNQITIPTGGTYRLNYANYSMVAGTAATVVLSLTRAATTYGLQTLAGSGVFTAGIDLLAGDTLQQAVSVIGAGGTADFILTATPENTNARVTLTYQNPPTLDAGINLYAGQQQYILDAKLIGQGIREDIHAVANVAGTIIGVMDIFTDCPCMLSEIQW